MFVGPVWPASVLVCLLVLYTLLGLIGLADFGLDVPDVDIDPGLDVDVSLDMPDVDVPDGAHVDIDFLQGLGRQVLPGMWFRDIRVSQGGGFLALEGSVLQPEMVPQLLKRLHDEPAFRGKAFRVVKFNLLDEGTGEIGFTLLTAAEEQKK